MTASKILLYFCLSFVGGIFINSLVKITQLMTFGVLVLAMILIFVEWQYKKLVFAGFCVLFLVLGIWRHQAAEVPVSLAGGQNNNEIITLTGIIIDEPDIGLKSQKLTIKYYENGSRDISGKILVTTGRYPEYKYGDKLELAGKLEFPSEDVNGFNYRDYLKKDGIYYVMSFPKINVLGSGFGNPIMKALFSFKNKFRETAQSLIPPPQIGFLEALVFGSEQNISQEWKDKLNLTGTRHIAAVSGMNITIISGLILNLFLAFGLWRQHAFFLSVALLVFYILMIGAPPSALRAGVMAAIFMTAQHFGRLSDGSRAIVFASAFMLAMNPLLLRLDAGFQLSFLAMMGLIYLQPHFSEWLKKIPNFKFFQLRMTLSATLSAQVFTLPILIYNFGYFSSISALPNILIVPFLAPLTILIFISGAGGMIFLPLGWLLSLPVFFGLSYVVKVVDLFSKIPFGLVKLENVHFVWLAALYLGLGFFVWRLQESKKLRFLRY
ncbi:MAG: ComEC/Rec2 family competence protein [bacterium]